MIAGLIPARGGSKGVPRKNIRPIAGEPLIAWSIKRALESKYIERVIVSTDDDEIAKIGERFGAEVLKRPDELATDTATTLSTLRHFVENIMCETVVLLQPTSPVRSKALIDACVREFIANGADSLATGYYCKSIEYGKNSKRRQDIDGFFYDDGNVYVIKAELIKNEDRYGEKIIRKVISREENMEIDDDLDFWLVEKILCERDYA